MSETQFRAEVTYQSPSYTNPARHTVKIPKLGYKESFPLDHSRTKPELEAISKAVRDAYEQGLFRAQGLDSISLNIARQPTGEKSPKSLLFTITAHPISPLEASA